MSARDYGAVRARRPGLLFWTVLLLGLIPVATLYGVDYLAERKRDNGIRDAWTIAGPACATLLAADYAARGFPAKERITEYDGVVLARQYGHVSCKGVANRGLGLFTHPVCQFTSPGVLRVKTAKGETLFSPGPGARATIEIEHGEPRCVIGGKLSLFDDPT